MTDEIKTTIKKGDYVIPKEHIDRAIIALKSLQGEESTDTAQNHIDADIILCNLLPHKIGEEFYKIHRWYE